MAKDNYKKRKRINRLLITLIFLGPSLVILCILFFYPVLSAIKTSFFSYYLPRPEAQRFVGLGNFKNIIFSGRFLNSLKITIILTGVAVVIEFLLGLGGALLLYAETIASKIAMKFILLPMMIPMVVTGLLMRWLFVRDWGMVNYFLSWVKVQPLSWLSEMPLPFIAILGGEVWQWTPFIILVLYAGLQSLPVEPFDAAKVDGATYFQTLLHVTMPLLKNLITFVLIMRIMDVFRLFDLIYAMTMGGPGGSTETLTLYNFQVAFRMLQLGQASAISVITTIILSIMTGVFLLLMYKREKGEF
jgi:multiple sugar transport system permease protein